MTIDKNTERVALRLDLDLLSKLRSLADAQDRKLSSYLRTELRKIANNAEPSKELQ